jgi:LCP family protein required for cell wall assembly
MAGVMVPGQPRSSPMRPRGVRIVRILSWLAVTLSVLTLTGAGVGYGLYRYYNSRVAHVNIRAQDASRIASVPGQQNFLIAGSDTRNFAGGSAFQGTSTGTFVSGQRSDTVILLHIPAGNGKATVVSFPRDAYVDIPARTDKSGSHPSYKAKLNEAFAVGGPPLLVQLIENLSGLHVDHYVEINFAGFQNMVNAVGGIDLCVQTTRSDKDSGDHLTAGTHLDVSGATALAFVRDRKGLPAGDLDRIKDQQYFLSQLLKKVLTANTLLNPLKVNAFLRGATADLTVDSEFGISQIEVLATRLGHLDPAHVTFGTIPYGNIGASRVIHGVSQSVVLLNSPQDDAFFRALKVGEQTPPPAANPPTPLRPDQVQLSVRNASGAPGLASKTAQSLRQRGFTILDIGTLPTGHDTVIRYPVGGLPAAETVARLIPGASTLLDPTTGHLELQLGVSFSGLAATPTTATPPAAVAPPQPALATALHTTCAP